VTRVPPRGPLVIRAGARAGRAPFLLGAEPPREVHQFFGPTVRLGAWRPVTEASVCAPRSICSAPDTRLRDPGDSRAYALYEDCHILPGSGPSTCASFLPWLPPGLLLHSAPEERAPGFPVRIVLGLRVLLARSSAVFLCTLDAIPSAEHCCCFWPRGLTLHVPRVSGAGANPHRSGRPHVFLASLRAPRIAGRWSRARVTPS